MVERVVINSEGVVHPELRTPFAYLIGLRGEIRDKTYGKGKALQMKNGGLFPPFFKTNVQIGYILAGRLVANSNIQYL